MNYISQFLLLSSLLYESSKLRERFFNSSTGLDLKKPEWVAPEICYFILLRKVIQSTSSKSSHTVLPKILDRNGFRQILHQILRTKVSFRTELEPSWKFAHGSVTEGPGQFHRFKLWPYTYIFL